MIQYICLLYNLEYVEYIIIKNDTINIYLEYLYYILKYSLFVFYISSKN